MNYTSIMRKAKPSSKYFVSYGEKCVLKIQSKNIGGFPAGPVAKTLSSQCRGPMLNPWSGNWILHATTKESQAVTKDPTCHN